MIEKGDKASAEEKQKRFKFLSDLYVKCCQCSRSETEKNIEKLGGYILIFSEKDRKDILSQLYNLEKNDAIYQKLLAFISKKYSFKSKSKSKIEGGKKSSSQNKDYKFGFEAEKDKNNFKKSRKKESGFGENKEISTSKFDWDNKKFGFKKEKKEPVGDINMKIINTKLYEKVEVKEIAPLKFTGLFLEISKYETKNREQNPFLGPSPFNKFYYERKGKIKKKILGENDEEKNEQ